MVVIVLPVPLPTTSLRPSTCWFVALRDRGSDIGAGLGCALPEIDESVGQCAAARDLDDTVIIVGIPVGVGAFQHQGAPTLLNQCSATGNIAAKFADVLLPPRTLIAESVFRMMGQFNICVGSFTF